MSFTGIPAAGFAIRGITYVQFGTIATGTATMTLGDVTPTITDGTEFATGLIKPSTASTDIYMDGIIVCASGTADRTAIVATFFGPNCLTVAAVHLPTADKLTTIPFFALFPTEDTTTLTASVRAGLSAAGTIRVNSNGAAAQVFNGNASSYFRVMEILAVR